MDENKNELLEEASEAAPEAEEVVEEIAEEAEELEELTEEAAASDEETAEDSTEAEKYVSKDLLLDEVIELRTVIKSLEKKNRAKTIALSVIGGIVGIVIILCSAAAIFNAAYNPYNHMGYSNFSGETLQSVADAEGISVKEIIAAYDLPSDMRGDTYWDVVTYMTPLYTMERNYEMAVEEIAGYFGFSEEVTREWTLGEAYDTVPVSVIVGEGEEFDDFIEEYELEAWVTPETPWGKVRKQVDKIDYKKYMDQQAAEEATEDVSEY